MRDVAARSGVSSALVSYVLHGRADRDKPASAEVQARVRAAAKELGYFPNANARSLKRQRTDRICVVTGSPEIPAAGMLIRRLQEMAHERGSGVVVVPVETDRDAHQAIELLQQGFCDGAVIEVLAARFYHSAELAALAERGTPVVVLSQTMEALGIDVVRNPEREICAEVLTTLIDKGRHRLAYLGLKDDQRKGNTGLRYQGYLDALHSRDLKRDPRLIVDGAAEDRISAYRATEHLLALKRPPDVIFASSDRGAISAIWAMRDAGVRIPDDIAVVGFGLLPEGEITRPGLTSIGQDPSRFAEIIDLLFARINGDESPPKEIVVPLNIVWRGST